MVGDKAVFSRESIQKKQDQAKEAYVQKTQELRKAFEMVAETPSGEKMLRYLFLICGGDLSSVRRNKDKQIDMDETLLALGNKVVWDTVRFNLTSETLKKIERHNWEE